MTEAGIARLPYLHDHHSHVTLYAALAGTPSLGSLPAGAEGAEQAQHLMSGLPGDRLSIVTGWRSDRFALPPEALAGLPPVLVVNSSLHGLALSPRGRAFAAELWPELAERADEPRWGERNLGRLFGFYGRIAGLDLGKLEAFMARMEGLGLGSLDDMTVAGEEALGLIASSRFAARIVPWATPEVFSSLPPGSRSRCAGVKLFLDGSLGARSAALDAPFADGPEGGLLYSDEELLGLASWAAGEGAGLSIHAIGRRAIEQAVGCLEALERGGARLRIARIEHAQFISLAQARRCKEAGIVLSMQPNFNSDSLDYSDRLSPRHRAENDPFRMLVDEARFVPGEDLLFGSDGMPHGPEAALRCSLFPPFESQRLSAAELEAGYGPAEGLVGEGSAFEIGPGLLRRLPAKPQRSS